MVGGGCSRGLARQLAFDPQLCQQDGIYFVNVLIRVPWVYEIMGQVPLAGEFVEFDCCCGCLGGSASGWGGTWGWVWFCEYDCAVFLPKFYEGGGAGVVDG